MKTNYFTGEYDYERREAQSEAAYFLECILPKESAGEAAKYVAKIAAHWRVVLGDELFQDFEDEWNKAVPRFKI